MCGCFYLLILCTVQIFQASQAKVEQSWKLKNDSNFFDINIGVGYGVGNENSRSISPRSTTVRNNYRQYSSEVFNEDNSEEDENSPQLQQSKFLNDEHFEVSPSQSVSYQQASNFYNPRPSIRELQKVVSNIGDKTQNSKIVQVVKIPAVYEIHLQSNKDREISKDSSSHVQLLPEDNFTPGKTFLDEYYAMNKDNFDKEMKPDIQQYIKPHKKLPNTFLTPAVDDSFDFTHYVKQTTDNVEHRFKSQIHQSKPKVYPTETSTHVQNNYYNHFKIPNNEEYNKNPLHTSPEDIASPNIDSFKYSDDASYQANSDTEVRHQNHQPFNHPPTVYQSNKYTSNFVSPPTVQQITPTSFHSFKTVSQQSKRSNKKIKPHARPRKKSKRQKLQPYSKSKFNNSYSTLNAFVPYGNEMRKKRKQQNSDYLRNTRFDFSHNLLPLDSTSSFSHDSRRSFIDNIQLTTNQPLMQPSYVQNRWNTDKAENRLSSIGSGEHQMHSKDIKDYIPLKFKIHIDEKTMFEDDRR